MSWALEDGVVQTGQFGWTQQSLGSIGGLHQLDHSVAPCSCCCGEPSREREQLAEQLLSPDATVTIQLVGSEGETGFMSQWLSRATGFFPQSPRPSPLQFSEWVENIKVSIVCTWFCSSPLLLWSTRCLVPSRSSSLSLKSLYWKFKLFFLYGSHFNHLILLEAMQMPPAQWFPKWGEDDSFRSERKFDFNTFFQKTFKNMLY